MLFPHTKVPLWGTIFRATAYLAIGSILGWKNIHLPSILMFTRGFLGFDNHSNLGRVRLAMLNARTLHKALGEGDLGPAQHLCSTAQGAAEGPPLRAEARAHMGADPYSLAPKMTMFFFGHLVVRVIVFRGFPKGHPM